MTASLGPRWAVTGPLEANALGGGGDIDGFKHLMTHLGPAARGMNKDMRDHEFRWDAAAVDAVVVASVTDELGPHDAKAAERKRDEQLLQVLRIKSGAGSG